MQSTNDGLTLGSVRATTSVWTTSNLMCSMSCSKTTMCCTLLKLCSESTTFLESWRPSIDARAWILNEGSCKRDLSRRLTDHAGLSAGHSDYIVTTYKTQETYYRFNAKRLLLKLHTSMTRPRINVNAKSRRVNSITPHSIQPSSASQTYPATTVVPASRDYQAHPMHRHPRQSCSSKQVSRSPSPHGRVLAFLPSEMAAVDSSRWRCASA